MSNLQHMLWMVDRKWGATKVKEIRGKEEFLDKLVWCERRMKNNLNWLISLLSGVKNENWNRTERTWCLNATSADIFQLTFFKTGQDTLQPKSGKFQQGDGTVSTCASGNERRWFQREIGTLCSREAGIFNETCHWQQNQILLKKGQDIKFLYNDRTLATFIQPIVLPTTFSLINASWGDSWNKWHPIDNEKCFECWKYKSRQTAELFTFRGREINLIFGSGNGDTSALEDQKPWNPYVEKKGFGYGLKGLRAEWLYDELQLNRCAIFCPSGCTSSGNARLSKLSVSHSEVLTLITRRRLRLPLRFPRVAVWEISLRVPCFLLRLLCAFIWDLINIFIYLCKWILSYRSGFN